MIFNLKKIALIQKGDPNNSNNDTVVTLTAINEGVDGSSVFGMTAEQEDYKIEGGQVYTSKINKTLDVRVLKPTGDAYTGKTNLQQLKDWVDNKTDLYFSAVTIDGGLFFGSTHDSNGLVKIAFNEQLSDTDVFAFKITKSSFTGFNNGFYEGYSWAGKNLIGMYEWGDANGDGLANGFSKDADITATFATNIQSLEVTSGTSSDYDSIFTNLYFPFEGETITFSLNYAGVTDLQIVIEAIDNTGSVTTTTFDDFSGTSRSSLSYTLQSGDVKIQPKIRIVGDDNTGGVDVSFPCLRVDGKTTYTKF